ncbi:hypothetical protein CU254_41205 (plasmid) [Amycolatopsis sp. AA4]|nr:hypothetical protein CU254_41205 [Amycolatopsis sp. AA4]
MDLGAGEVLVLDGQEWTVERAEPRIGRVVLVNATGERKAVSIRFLMHHPDCRQSTRTGGPVTAACGRQEPTAGDLTLPQRDLVALPPAHLVANVPSTPRPRLASGRNRDQGTDNLIRHNKQPLPRRLILLGDI